MNIKSDRVYFILGGSLIKIGSTNDIEVRLRTMQVGSPVKLEVITTITGDNLLESDLHSLFNDYRKSGEWFALGPRLEDFLVAIVGYEEDRLALEEIILDFIADYGEPLELGEIPPVAHAMKKIRRSNDFFYAL